MTQPTRPPAALIKDLNTVHTDLKNHVFREHLLCQDTAAAENALDRLDQLRKLEEYDDPQAWSAKVAALLDELEQLVPEWKHAAQKT
jgi:hypothetical protein